MRDRSMAVGGRSSRGGGGGKRGGGAPSSSSSSATASACVYYATTALLVALCVAGAYFLTSSSAASVAAAGADGDGDAAAVTAYRHTTRPSFAYEVNAGREKEAAPSPPREAGGSDEEEPDQDKRGVAEEEEEEANKTDDSPDEGSAKKGSSAASSVEDERNAHGGDEELEEKERHEHKEGEGMRTVEEKSLDGGVEEESGGRREEAQQPEEEEDPDQTQTQNELDEEKMHKADVEELDGGDGEKEDKEWSKQAVVDLPQNEEESTAASSWRLCNVKSGADYIPCLDNERAIKKLRPENFRRYEHRERHCPDEGPTCLVPLPAGYRRPVEWPSSRDRVWYANVPHTKLVEVKGHQNWVKVSGDQLRFPGGGTQFIHGALHYIDFLQQSSHGIRWGKRTRVVLDVGCGVASFGGYLFERDVVTMSFAPKDEHEAQVQMALERGIPAISAVMGSKRLPFPANAFDLVHCARCRVPWHADGGKLLLELNRVLRPGGLFVWSATPVYQQKLTEDVQIWKAVSGLTRAMCWDLVSVNKDRLNGVGVAFYRKPTTNDCYHQRAHQQPPMCSDDDDDAAWYIRLNSCMHQMSQQSTSNRGAKWPVDWPRRLRTPPYWLPSSSSDSFTADLDHWRRVVNSSYLDGLGIDWSRVRNVMDMRATYGGFAAALKLIKEKQLWVMNVVNVDAPDTLPVIFERGLLGIYHDWCESFSTYPRTYDLLHADRLFSTIKDRCALLPVVVEVDRIVRPGGSLIVRDDAGAVADVEKLLRSLHWDVRLTFSKDDQGVLYAEKSNWRPEALDEPS